MQGKRDADADARRALRGDSAASIGPDAVATTRRWLGVVAQSRSMTVAGIEVAGADEVWRCANPDQGWHMGINAPILRQAAAAIPMTARSVL